jgi:hypothetical protein
VLLDKQDQLRVLEQNLDEFDKFDANRQTNDLDADDSKPRKELLHEIETLFLSYGVLIYVRVQRFTELTAASKCFPMQPEPDGKQSSVKPKSVQCR